MSAVISVGDLADALASGTPPTVIDVRWRLNGPPAHADYLASHIPGAAFLDLDAELCGRPGAGGRHPLPEPGALCETLRAAGVRVGHPVVAYDDGDGMAAARLWWTLRWAGHREVRVLDGGFAAWTAAGLPVTDETPDVKPGDLEVRPGAMPILDASDAAEVARDGILLDVRAAARYRGETEPIDPVAGHIPGAVNLPINDLVDGPGSLADRERLRARLERAGVAPGAPVGAYCGSGVTAALAVLALSEAGVPDPALYVGSWSHWITDPTRPIATGDGG